MLRLRGGGLALADLEQARVGERFAVLPYIRAADAAAWRFREVGGPVESLFGLPAAELVNGEGLLERLVHPDDRARVRTAAAQMRETGEAVALEYRVVTSDGAVLHVHDTAVPVTDEDGVLRFHGVLVDVTRHQLLEARFLQGQKLEALGRFAGGIAHDFRNVLTVIGGYAALLAGDLDPATAAHGYARSILGASEHAAGLTGRLLAFSRSQTAELEPVDLHEAVRAFAQMLGPLLRPTISLHVDCAATNPMVLAEVHALEQVLLNLAANAQDAMPEGGALAIAVADACSTTPGAGADGEDVVVLSVADTGHGMDRPTVERILEPFFTTKREGTGLGLATVNEIVRQHGGRLWIWSRPGCGARFDIHLARAPQAVAEP